MTDELMAEIVRRIVAALAPERIILFGSHARGDAGPDSDIDLLVIKSEVTNVFEAGVRARRAVDDIRRPFDILVRTPEHFARYSKWLGSVVHAAANEGKMIYERATEAELNVRMWIKKADADLAFADAAAGKEAFSEPRSLHYQQAAEKYIKALLISLEIDPHRTHDIGRLLSDCEAAGVGELETIREAEGLSVYAVEPLSADDFITVTLQEAERAGQIANEVKRFVIRHLPFSLDD